MVVGHRVRRASLVLRVRVRVSVSYLANKIKKYIVVLVNRFLVQSVESFCH